MFFYTNKTHVTRTLHQLAKLDCEVAFWERICSDSSVVDMQMNSGRKDIMVTSDRWFGI